MKIKSIMVLISLVGCSLLSSVNIRAGEEISSVGISQQPPKKDKKFIKGVIKDADGEPLPGVTVRIKGARRGVYSDVNGEYRIDLEQDDKVIIFSMIGMIQQEIKIGDQTEIDVVLQDDVNKIDEVVVTGVFTKSKESYTGSVATVDRQTLKQFKGQNMLQTLSNIDASINIAVNNITGSDPNSLPGITIRGGANIPSISELDGYARQQTNFPLIIMDGFEVSINKLKDFNDEEIESINILKDASATAIYGSRGANGVIVIVTREPESGDLRIQGSAGINLEIPDLSSYHILNSKQKLSLEKFVGLYADANDPDKHIRLQKIYNERLAKVLKGTDVDWMRIPLQVGKGRRYSARLDGGSKDFRWSTGVNYNTVNGAMKGSLRDNFMADLSLIYNKNSFIFRNSVSVGTTKAQESKYGGFQQYVDQQPYNNPYDEFGQLVKNFPNFDNSTTTPNPLWNTQLNMFNITKNYTFIDNFSLDWLITKDFRVRGQIAFQYNSGRIDNFKPAEHTDFDIDDYRSAEGRFRRGSYSLNSNKSVSYDGRLTFSYSKLFADRHQLYAGLDLSAYNAENISYEIKAEGYSNQHLSTLGNAKQYKKNTVPRGYETINRRLGVTGNINYIYDNRFFLDASYRMDGSSDFGANRRWAPFWSLGFGWNLHNEEFMRKYPAINIFRLKGSVGDVGQVNFQRNNVETTYSYISDNQYLDWIAASLNRWGNPDLTWQITRSYNFGTEIAFFKNLVNIQFDVYQKKTSNLLFEASLPFSSGFDYYTANVGQVQNRGFEFTTNFYLLRNYEKDYRWQASFQIAYNQSKIIELADEVKAQQEARMNLRATDVSRFLIEGQPVNSLYAVKSAGIEPAYGNEVFFSREGNIVKDPSPLDKVYLGQGEPPFRGILTSMFYYKGLSVNISAGFHWGGLMYNSTLQDKVEVSKHDISFRNVDERVMMDRWKKTGDRVFFKNFEDGGGRQQSSRFVMRDNVFDIRSLSIQYRWDTPFVKKTFKLRSLNFSLNVNNILEISSVRMERGTSYPFARSIIGSVSFYY